MKTPRCMRLVATRDVEAGEVLLSVPKRLLLTAHVELPPARRCREFRPEA